ncbi:hypothetical protein C8Q80DRAFT_1119456 [Daedaleopsis nitida]|nr:hypothetical protein C8Q80DRAFT_1119456 [Daedaleopsis nitida]
MASTLVSEDLVRTLSCLVFACIPPGKTTIKLFDPVSGELEEYHLAKVSAGSPTASSSVEPPPQAKKVPRPVLKDVMQPPKAVEGPKGSQPKVNLVSYHGVNGPLARLKRALYHRDDSRIRRSAPGWADGSCLLDQTRPWDTESSDSGDWSAEATPLKPRPSSSSSWSSSLSSPLGRLAQDDESSPFDTTCSTPGNTSRLVGLGFSLVNTDGTPFDGLGSLDDSSTRASSPTDEAHARVCQRRGVRPSHPPMLFETVPTSRNTPRPAVNPTLMTAAASDDVDCFGSPAGVSTPMPPGASARVPQAPAAPARRVLGRLPVEFTKDKEPKARRSLVKPLREPSPPGAPFQPRSSARRECCVSSGSGSKRSPAAVASTPVADPLRFWTHWMTPVSEKDGRAKAVWRP